MDYARVPKLIYVLERGQYLEAPKFWYLTKLPRCAKRMVSGLHLGKEDERAQALQGQKLSHGDACIGCRSFLTPDRSGNGWNNVANAGNYEPGKPKYYGPFNQGVVTINLVDVALSSGGDQLHGGAERAK